MKTKRALATGLAILSLSAASQALAWGGAELQQAAPAALEALKADYGQEAFDSVVSVSAEVTSQGTGAKAVVTYRENGQKLTASFFCHTHDTEIDCH